MDQNPYQSPSPLPPAPKPAAKGIPTSVGVLIILAWIVIALLIRLAVLF